jgi:hypothetical protein
MIATEFAERVRSNQHKLVLFSAMNYFTHIGLLMNTSDSL